MTLSRKKALRMARNARRMGLLQDDAAKRTSECLGKYGHLKGKKGVTP